MFKKLKDKLAEEVKSSPQRIQQIAQAAQAAVTSASSSISDITNNDLFSIGDNDGQQALNKISTLPEKKHHSFQDVPLTSSGQSKSDPIDNFSNQEENQRQRRLSNSSFASDVSFRLPSYESPSMYHLQSDMEVSASEAEERAFTGSSVSLERVTKEQLYAAYRRTQERYTKYRTQYADLARHYKLLERENAKARSVLVETQDKALRRISELKEQCTLEQSAKAHLEKALRIEIEEKNMKIDALNTKIKFLQNESQNHSNISQEGTINKSESDAQLIDLSIETEGKIRNDQSATEITTLNNKIDKLELLVNKYKESLKTAKDKNAQMTTELQILSTEIENKNKENEQLKVATVHLTEARQKIQELNEINEELQNKVNAYDFNKTKELSTLEIDFQKAQEEIVNLQNKIEVFSKREEDYAISLAENKLSIHKELESKEAEIKSLKDSLSASKKEIQSLNIVLSDYKNTISLLEEEKLKLSKEFNEINIGKTKIAEIDSQLLETTQKLQLLEQLKIKADEEYKCLQLQLKQESAEKLAMIDRNDYLENRNTQLNNENSKKSLQISKLEGELHEIKKYTHDVECQISHEKNMLDEINMWKTKYSTLESEIQEDRDELVKLQSEIEKLLANHELIQNENLDLHNVISELKSENVKLRHQVENSNKIKAACHKLIGRVKDLQQIISLTAEETKSLKIINSEMIPHIKDKLNFLLCSISQVGDVESIKISYNELQKAYYMLERDLKNNKDSYETTVKELQLSQQRNENLKLRIQDTESENGLLREKIEHINKQYNDNLNKIELLKTEKKSLYLKVEELESQCQEHQLIIKKEQDLCSKMITKYEEQEKINENLNKKLENIENQNESLKRDLHTSEKQLLNSINTLEKTNIELQDKLMAIENTESNIKQLEENNNYLKTENQLLSNQLKEISKNFDDLQLKMDELQHEKDRLISNLHELEDKEHKKTLNVVNNMSQTDVMQQIEECVTCQNDETDNMKKQNENSDEIMNVKYSALKNENDILREENRRLNSDIEGLQTYLTKMSKENSVLNDNLRELIASGESFSDKNDSVSCDLPQLKMEIQSVKEKLDDLTRENNLLIEENLELKDQIQSQNSITSNQTQIINISNKDQELNSFKEKYNKILESKNNLEKQMTDLEITNNTVTGSMLQVQEKNDRLKLLNEKLERRLDEALVSLRHLHSLQENTELEYLRNILYEYLTGSGIHSITLAKVLSAVVKFDDKQTQIVMQKEKERQGLLRQMGLI